MGMMLDTNAEIVELVILKEKAKVVSFSRPDKSDDLALKLITRSGILFEFNFVEAILFIYKSAEFSKLCMNKVKSPLFQIAMDNAYQPINYPIPCDAPEKIYQFMDDNNTTIIEIIAEEFDFKII